MADEKNKVFTIDADTTGVEMPTLSSLLYKKKAVKSESSPQPTQIEEAKPITTLEPTHVSLVAEKPNATSPKIVQSQFQSPRATAPQSAEGVVPGTAIRPTQWVPESAPRVQFTVPESLAQSPSPILQGVRVIQERTRLHGALVFESGDAAGVFRAVGCVGLDERSDLFTGMQFDSNQFSDLWNRLSRFGFIEFSPLGISGQGNFDRAAFRTAFGVSGNEWMTLVRLGTSDAVYGVAVLFTEGSVQTHLPHFHRVTGTDLNRPAA